MKKLFIICGSFLIIVVLLQKTWPDSLFHIIFCDVGQGDAMIFSLHFIQIVIDVGKNEQVVACLEENLPWWDRKIEVLALSHPDNDHTGGFSALKKRYHFSRVLLSVGRYPDEVISYCQATGNCSVFGQNDKLSFSNIKNDIVIEGLWPPLHSRKTNSSHLLKPETNKTQKNNTGEMYQNTSEVDQNDSSLVLNIRYRDVKTLAMGDVSEEVDLSLIDHILPNGVDIIKISHHGSKYSTSELLIGRVRPEIALIGVGRNNRFGHPATRVIDLLRSSNIQTYRTDEDGTIHLVSDGYSVWGPK